MANVLSDRIAELRRERGLTQEQLGQLVGVSAQAVSKWEKGGAPDVELLPALADRLGVTIDALFGREGGEAVDIHRTAARWLHTIPEAQRFDQICRLCWTLTKNLVNEVAVPNIGYLERATMGTDQEEWLGISRVYLDQGIVLGLHAEDLSFSTVWPEPKDGYDAYFLPMDEYRALFSILSKPGCLEVLEYLYSRPYRHYVPETVAHALALSVQDVQALLDGLQELRILSKTELELVDGLTNAYSRQGFGTSLVPFFYMARCVMQMDGYMFNVCKEEKPLLRGGVWKTKKEAAE